MSPTKKAPPLADPRPTAEALAGLGRFLRERREGVGLSLRQVAATLRERGVDLKVDRLRRMEVGEAQPALWEAAALAGLYGCGPEELLDQLWLPQWARPGVRTLRSAKAHRAAWAAALARGDAAGALAHALHMEARAVRPKRRCWAWNNQAAALWKLGHLEAALRLLRRALQDPGATDPELQVYLWHNLVEVNRSLGHRPLAGAAVVQARAALARWPAPRSKAAKVAQLKARAMILNGEGNLLSDTYELATPSRRSLQDWRRAERAYEEARAVYEELKLEAELAIVILNLGLLHALAERWEAAQKELDQGLAAAQRLHHPRLIALGLVQQGRCAAWRKNLVTAWDLFEQAVPLVEGKDDMADLHFQVCYHLVTIGRRRRQWAAVKRYTRDLEQVYPKVRMPSRERRRYEARRQRGPDNA